jgi:hypothetical protein
MIRPFVYLVAQIALLSAAVAQQSIGTIGVQDANVSGALEISNGRAVLVGNTTVTAKDHDAEVELQRGGKVLVCATSGLHLTAGKSSQANQPLMLALDRGAIEVQMDATSNDVVMTPDLRFAVQGNGPLDLRLRVTKSGDTCVDNHGTSAPTLRVVDPFGEATYDLRAGQHVLFEHGSLKEVVDRETSPCGCPPPIVSVADAGTTGSTAAAPGSVVAADHPFPAAVSQGLAPEPPVPAVPAGTVHAQVAATLNYEAGATPEASGSVSKPAAGGDVPAAASGSVAPSTASGSPAVVKAEALPAPAPPSPTGLAHRIGHFFKRLFGG